MVFSDLKGKGPYVCALLNLLTQTTNPTKPTTPLLVYIQRKVHV